MSRQKFEAYSEVMVIRLTPYLIDLGFKANKRYSVSTDGQVEGINRSSNRNERTDAQRGLYVRCDESGHYVRISDVSGRIITGAGECFGPYQPKPRKKSKSKPASNQYDVGFSLSDRFIIADASVTSGQWQITYPMPDSDVTDAIRYVAETSLPQVDTIAPNSEGYRMAVHIDTQQAEAQLAQAQHETQQLSENLTRMIRNRERALFGLPEAILSYSEADARLTLSALQNAQNTISNIAGPDFDAE